MDTTKVVTAEATPEEAPQARRAGKWLARIGPFLGLVFVILIFGFMSGAPARYFSVNNFRIVLSQTIIVGLGAIGMTVIMVSGGIDLSVGSTIALSSVITALGLRDGWSPLIAIGAGILIGGFIGGLNGLAITRLRVVPFIVTLGMLGIGRGTAKWLAGEQTVNAPATWVNQLAVTFPTPSWLFVAAGVWIMVALAILMALVLRNTVFGRRIFAIGSNEAAARACGIQVSRMKVAISTLGGFFVGVDGVF